MSRPDPARPEPVIPNPTDCPYYLISRATLAITAELRRGLAEAGVGQVRASYLGVLMALWRQDDLQVGELGRRAGLEPSTMTGLLDRMGRDGLLERRADPRDRRALRVGLTPRGWAQRVPVMSAVADSLERALRDIPGDQLQSAKSALRQILMNTSRMSRP